ncbi:unnamed protein product [Durusdinium trenchii]|uniref:Uncharacterized protein n=1 Tax=Durusdinium trenchii TaxID=1381693 RepID=A0ABP0N7G4_9DINO
MACGKLILLCGASGSGKSSLAATLGEAIGATLLHQDNYFLKAFVRYQDRVDDSFEGPDHVNWPRLRCDTLEALKASDWVIVEGHLVAGDQELSSHASMVVSLHCPPDLCKARRLQRRKRPEKEEEELADYIDLFVSPAFLRYGRPALDAVEKSCGRAVRTRPRRF